MTIIKSLLDTDFYKFTMGAFIHRYYPQTQTTFAFTNRTKQIKMADIIDMRELEDQLDWARALTFTKDELEYLNQLTIDEERVFPPEYIAFLANYRLPEFRLREVNGQIDFRTTGKWQDTTYWETIALTIINQLYFDALEKDLDPIQKRELYAQAATRLDTKLNRLKDEADIVFADFGHRRRHSADWHDYVVKTTANQMKQQFLGTSNVFFAKKYNLKPIGTMAHELFMVATRADTETNEQIKAGHNKVLTQWYEMYGNKLSVVLTDTFGTEYFFENVPTQVATDWRGLRQDSGDPIAFGERAISFYEKHSVKNTPNVFFSDGLDVGPMIEINTHFQGRLNTGFGWGTLLTNDFRDLMPERADLYRPLSIVIKAVEADGKQTVKLSDNPAKAMGNREDIALFKQLFEYKEGQYQECIV